MIHLMPCSLQIKATSWMKMMTTSSSTKEASKWRKATLTLIKRLRCMLIFPYATFSDTAIKLLPNIGISCSHPLWSGLKLSSRSIFGHLIRKASNSNFWLKLSRKWKTMSPLSSLLLVNLVISRNWNVPFTIHFWQYCKIWHFLNNWEN